MMIDAANVGNTLRRAKSLPDVQFAELNEIFCDSISPSEIGLQYDQETYKMNHSSRGVALIINVMHFDNDPMNERTRYGSDYDVELLKNVFEDDLKFDVMECKKTDYRSIMKDLEAVSKMNHSDKDCLMICIMTHGKYGKLFASDHPFELELVWSYFIGDKCRSLIGKPKIIMIQACRGDGADKGVNYYGHGFATDANNYVGNFLTIPTSADQLTVYATNEGFSAIRTRFGTWFIQELCKHLRSNKTDDLASILTNVSRKIALKIVLPAPRTALKKDLVGAKQIPVVVSTLTKKVFFHDTDQSQLLPRERNTTLRITEHDETVKHMTQTAEYITEAAKNIKKAAQSFAESVNSFRTQSNGNNAHQYAAKTSTSMSTYNASSKIPTLKK